jgi:hypothetical protein
MMNMRYHEAQAPRNSGISVVYIILRNTTLDNDNISISPNIPPDF